MTVSLGVFLVPGERRGGEWRGEERRGEERRGYMYQRGKLKEEVWMLTARESREKGPRMVHLQWSNDHIHSTSPKKMEEKRGGKRNEEAKAKPVC